MAAMGDLFKELLDRQADAMKQYQDALADSVKAWQDALSSRPDDMTAFPDASKLAESYFNFASEMLSRQHEFALKLIDAMRPTKS